MPLFYAPKFDLVAGGLDQCLCPFVFFFFNR